MKTPKKFYAGFVIVLLIVFFLESCSENCEQPCSEESCFFDSSESTPMESNSEMSSSVSTSHDQPVEGMLMAKFQSDNMHLLINSGQENILGMSILLDAVNDEFNIEEVDLGFITEESCIDDVEWLWDGDAVTVAQDISGQFMNFSIERTVMPEVSSSLELFFDSSCHSNGWAEFSTVVFTARIIATAKSSGKIVMIENIISPRLTVDDTASVVTIKKDLSFIGGILTMGEIDKIVSVNDIYGSDTEDVKLENLVFDFVTPYFGSLGNIKLFDSVGKQLGSTIASVSNEASGLAENSGDGYICLDYMASDEDGFYNGMVIAFPNSHVAKIITDYQLNGFHCQKEVSVAMSNVIGSYIIGGQVTFSINGQIIKKNQKETIMLKASINDYPNAVSGDSFYVVIPDTKNSSGNHHNMIWGVTTDNECEINGLPVYSPYFDIYRSLLTIEKSSGSPSGTAVLSEHFLSLVFNVTAYGSYPVQLLSPSFVINGTKSSGSVRKFAETGSATLVNRDTGNVMIERYAQSTDFFEVVDDTVYHPFTSEYCEGIPMGATVTTYRADMNQYDVWKVESINGRFGVARNLCAIYLVDTSGFFPTSGFKQGDRLFYSPGAAGPGILTFGGVTKLMSTIQKETTIISVWDTLGFSINDTLYAYGYDSFGNEAEALCEVGSIVDKNILVVEDCKMVRGSELLSNYDTVPIGRYVDLPLVVSIPSYNMPMMESFPRWLMELNSGEENSIGLFLPLGPLGTNDVLRVDLPSMYAPWSDGLIGYTTDGVEDVIGGTLLF